jgi:hypothetical protein
MLLNASSAASSRALENNLHASPRRSQPTKTFPHTAIENCAQIAELRLLPYLKIF